MTENLDAAIVRADALLMDADALLIGAGVKPCYNEISFHPSSLDEIFCQQ